MPTNQESLGFTYKQGCFESKRECLQFLSNLLAMDPSCVRGGHIRGLDNGTTASSKGGNSGSLREEMNTLPGIIWLCKMPETSENLEFNNVADAEAKAIKNITGAKIFKGATADFMRTLNENKDIKWIHFIGHGGFEDEDGMTTLCMTNEDGNQERLLMKDVVEALKGRKLSLVVLNGCETKKHIDDLVTGENPVEHTWGWETPCEGHGAKALAEEFFRLFVGAERGDAKRAYEKAIELMPLITNENGDRKHAYLPLVALTVDALENRNPQS